MLEDKSAALIALGESLNELEQGQPGIYKSPFMKNILQLDEPVDSYTKQARQFTINTTPGALQKQRATNQSHWDQAGNAALRLGNIVPKTIGYTASMFDFDTELGRDKEYSNWITESMLNLAQDIDESLPIHREEPEKFLDYSDPAWWFSSTSSIAQELPAFWFPGFAVGKLAGAGAKLASVLSGGAMKWGAKALPAIEQFAASAKTSKQLQALIAQGGSAYAMNKIESTLVAGDMFKTTYAKELERHGDEELARKNASIAASISYKSNLANIALNMTMAGRIMKAPTASRAAIKQLSLMKTAKGVGFEAGQEALEEGINLWSEKEGERAYAELIKGKNQDRTLLDYMSNFAANFGKDVMTREGAEAMLFGAVGGAGMTMGSAGMNMVKRPEQYTDPKTGKTSTRWISPNAKHEELYQKQQEAIKPFKQAMSGDGKTNMFTTLLSAERQANNGVFLDTIDQLDNPQLSDPERQKIIEEATSKLIPETGTNPEAFEKQMNNFRELFGKSKEELNEFAEEKRKGVIEEQVWQFSQEGGLDNLTAIYKDITEMSTEQAMEKGFGTDYAERAQQAISYIEDLADQFDAHVGKYSQPVLKEIFSNRGERLKEDSSLTKMEKERAEMVVEDDDVAHAKGLDLQIERKKKAIDKLDEQYKEMRTKEGQEKIEAETKKSLKKLIDELGSQADFLSKRVALQQAEEDGGKVYHTKDGKETKIIEENGKYYVMRGTQKVELTPENIDAYSAHSAEDWEKISENRAVKAELKERARVLNKLKKDIDDNQAKLTRELKELSETLKNDIEKLNAAIAKIKKKGFLRDGQSQLAILIRTLEEKIEKAEAKIAKSEARLEDLAGIRVVIADQLAKVEKEVLVDYQELQEDAQEFLDRMREKGLQTMVDFDKYIKHTKKRIATTKGQITKLKNKVEKLEAILESAETLETIREEIQRINRFKEKWPEEAELLRQVNYVIADLPNTSQIGLKLFPNFAQDVTDYINLMQKRRKDNEARVKTQNDIYLIPDALAALREELNDLQETLELLEDDKQSFLYASHLIHGIKNLDKIMEAAITENAIAAERVRTKADSKENADSIMGDPKEFPPPNPESQDQKATKEGYKPPRAITPLKSAGKQVKTKWVDGVEVNDLDEQGNVQILDATVDGVEDADLTAEQERWFNALNHIDDPTKYEFRIVPYIDGDPASEKFFTKGEIAWNKENPGHKSVKLVLYNKTGQYVTGGGGPVVTRLPSRASVTKIAKPEIIKLLIQEKFSQHSGLLTQYSKEGKIDVPVADGTVEYTEEELYDLAIKEYADVLDTLRATAYKNGREHKATFVPITGISQGIPNLLPAQDGVRQTKKITDTIPYAKIRRIWIPKDENDFGRKVDQAPNMTFKRGSVYIETKDGRIIEALQRNINPGEAKILLKLFYHGFGKLGGEKGGFGKLPVQWAKGKKWEKGGDFVGVGNRLGFIDSLIYFGKRKPNAEGNQETFEIYYDTTAETPVIRFGGYGEVDPKNLIDEKGNPTEEAQELLEFLQNLRRNVNKKLINKQLNYTPIKNVTNDGTVVVHDTVKSHNTLSGFERYLLTESTRILSTDLVPESPTQFLNRYMIFSPVTQTRNIKAAEEAPVEESPVETVAEPEGDVKADTPPQPNPTPPVTVVETPTKDLKLTELDKPGNYLLHTEAGSKFIVTKDENGNVELHEEGGPIEFITAAGYVAVIPEDQLPYVQTYVKAISDFYTGVIDENSEDFFRAESNLTKATVFDQDNDIKDPPPSTNHRKLVLQGDKVVPLNTAKAEKWLKKVFGNNITVELAESLLEAGAAAEVIDNLFRFTSLTEEGSEFHEAIHFVARKFFTKKEWDNSVISEARSKVSAEEIADMREKTLDKTADGWLNPDGKLLNKEEADKYALEEIIAEDFRTFMLEGITKFPKNETWYQWLWNKVKTFLKIMQDNRLTIEDLYSNINSSVYARETSPNAVRNRRVLSLQGTLVVDNVTTYEFFEGMAAQLFSNLFDQETAKPLFLGGTKLTETLHRNLDAFRDILALKNKSLKQKGLEVPPGHANLERILFNKTSLLRKTTDPKESRKHYTHVVAEFNEFLSQFGIDVGEAVNKIKDWDKVTEMMVDEETGELNTNDSATQFNDIAAQYDTKDHTPKPIRMLIASIQTDKKNNLGLPIMNDFAKTYIKLAKILAGSTGNFDDMLRRIDNEATFQNEPIIREFVAKLKKYDDDHGERLRTQFAVEFSNALNTFLTTLIDKGKIYTADTNNARTEKLILANWEADFKQNLIADTGTLEFSTDLQQEFVDMIAEHDLKAKENVEGRKNSIKNGLSILGIEFSNFDLAFKTSIDDLSLLELTKYIATTIQEMLDAGKPMSADQLYERLEEGGVSGRLKQLAQIEAVHNKNHIDLQSQSSDGKTIYNLGLHTNITTTISRINEIVDNSPTAEAREKALRTEFPYLFTKYQVHSIIWDRIVNEGIKIEHNKQEGIRLVTPGAEGETLKGLSMPDRLTMFINGAMENTFPFLRAADRGVEDAFKIGDSFLVTTKGDMIITMIGYLIDEMATARDLILNNNGSDIRYYNEFGKTLRIFKDILPAELIEVAQTTIENETLSIDNFAKSRVVQKGIEDWLNKVIKEESDYLEDHGIFRVFHTFNKDSKNTPHLAGISDEHMKKFGSKERIVELYTMNAMSHYIEQMKLFVGDPAYFKNIGDNFKRYAMFNSTKEVSRTDATFNQWLVNRRPYHTAEQQAAVEQNVLDGVIETIIYADHEFPTEYMDELVKGFNDSFDKDEEITGRVVDRKTKVKYFEKAYEGVNEADAFGIISIEAYRHLLERGAQWTDDHEAAYQKIMEGKPLRPSEMYYFQPQKTQYTGPLHDKRDKLYVPAGYKHVLMPIYPQLVKGSNLEPLYKHMQKNGIGIAQFISGNKFGTILNDGELQSFYKEHDTVDGDGNAIKETIVNLDVITQKIDYKYFGIQQKMAPKVKTEVTPGSQAMMHVIADMYNNGSALKNEDLLTRYHDQTKQLLAHHFNKLKEDFDIQLMSTPIADQFEYVIGNRQKFVQFIKKELTKRNPDDNVLAALNSLMRHDTKIDELPNHRKIQNLIFALVQARAVRAKRPGRMLVQIPTTGSEKRGKGNIAGDNHLKFYRRKNGKILPMEVEIPLPTQWIDFMERHYGTLEKLNEAIKAGNSKLPKELLQFVGFRIPTQGMNSIEYMEIAGFLPPQSAEVIRVPSNIVAKTGGDFDVDKLTMYFANFTIDENGIPTYVNDGDGVRTLENQLLQTQIELIRQADFRALTAPIDDQILKKTAGELHPQPDASFTDLIRPSKNMDKFYEFLAGKMGVAQTALQSTNNVLAQIAGLHIEEDIPLFFKHNVTETGKPSLAHIHDQNQNRITETLAAFLTAYVDIAKEPYIFHLNFTNKVADTIFYMIRLGVDPVWLAHFAAQPVITKYIKEEGKRTAEIFKGRGLKDDKLLTTKKDLISSLIVNDFDIDYDSLLSTMQDTKATQKTQGGVSAKLNSAIEEKIMEYSQKIGNMSIEDLQNATDKPVQQIRMLDSFLEYTRQSRNLSKLIKATNLNTKGVGQSIEDARLKQKQKQEILDDGFFNPESVEKMFTHTFLGGFEEIVKETDAMFSPQYFSMQKQLGHRMMEFKEVAATHKYGDKKNNAYQAVQDDFLLYMIMTLKDESGNLILDVNDRHRLIGNDSPVFKALRDIKKDNKHPLHYNRFIQEVIPDINEKENVLKMFNKRKKPAEINAILEDFHKIKMVDTVLAEQIVKISLLQHGLTTAPNAFQQIVPVEEIFRLLSKGKKQIPQDTALLNKWFTNFEKQFQRNKTNLKYLKTQQKSFDEFTTKTFYGSVIVGSPEAKLDFAVFWTRDKNDESVPNLLVQGEQDTYKGVNKLKYEPAEVSVLGSKDRKVYYPEGQEPIPPKTLDQLRGEAFAEMSDELTAEMFEDYSQSVQQSSKVNYYEGNITPSPNTIFVFGSNPEGRHGAGAAKIAKDKFGAKYGQGKGLQGNAYAIPTKDLRVKENKGLKSISRYEIQGSIQKMYDTARANPDKQFKVAYRNTTEVSLNGYTGLEMIDMFNVAAEYDLILNTTPGIPSNVIFSKEWFDTGKLNIQPTQQISEAKSENISSKGSEFAQDLTNPGNNLKVTYKGREFRNAEHAYQTYKSGEFDQKAYNSNAFKPVGSKPANRNTNYQTMVDILKAKLEQHPELIEGINKRGGLAYIKESTHNVTGDKFWESKGQNKFIEALADAYQSIRNKDNTKENKTECPF